MGKKNLVSINDFSRDEILKIMELAAGFEARGKLHDLEYFVA